MTTDLPNWVYDVVRDLVHQEEIHPRLLFMSGGFTGTQKYDWCPGVPLALVPTDVQEHARALNQYLGTKPNVEDLAAQLVRAGFEVTITPRKPAPCDHPQGAGTTCDDCGGDVAALMPAAEHKARLAAEPKETP